MNKIWITFILLLFFCSGCLAIKCHDEEQIFEIGDIVCINIKYPSLRKQGPIHRITRHNKTSYETYLLYHVKIYDEKMEGFIFLREQKDNICLVFLDER